MHDAGLYIAVPDWVARRKDISHGAKLTYARLLWWHGSTGQPVDIALDTLGAAVGVGARQVMDYRTELVLAGLIRVERMGGSRPNRYHIIGVNEALKRGRFFVVAEGAA